MWKIGLAVIFALFVAFSPSCHGKAVNELDDSLLEDLRQLLSKHDAADADTDLDLDIDARDLPDDDSYLNLDVDDPDAFIDLEHVKRVLSDVEEGPLEERLDILRMLSKDAGFQGEEQDGDDLEARISEMEAELDERALDPDELRAAGGVLEVDEGGAADDDGDDLNQLKRILGKLDQHQVRSLDPDDLREAGGVLELDEGGAADDDGPPGDTLNQLKRLLGKLDQDQDQEEDQEDLPDDLRRLLSEDTMQEREEGDDFGGYKTMQLGDDEDDDDLNELRRLLEDVQSQKRENQDLDLEEPLRGLDIAESISEKIGELIKGGQEGEEVVTDGEEEQEEGEMTKVKQGEGAEEAEAELIAVKKHDLYFEKVPNIDIKPACYAQSLVPTYTHVNRCKVIRGVVHRSFCTGGCPSSAWGLLNPRNPLGIYKKCTCCVPRRTRIKTAILECIINGVKVKRLFRFRAIESCFCTPCKLF